MNDHKQSNSMPMAMILFMSLQYSLCHSLCHSHYQSSSINTHLSYSTTNSCSEQLLFLAIHNSPRLISTSGYNEFRSDVWLSKWHSHCSCYYYSWWVLTLGTFKYTIISYPHWTFTVLETPARLTLPYFAAASTSYLGNETNISLSFLPGNHSLDRDLSLSHAENFSMIGNNGTVFIECGSQSRRFNISDTTLAMIKDLHFIGWEVTELAKWSSL